MLEFSLSDGRRLAWHAQRPAEVVQPATKPTNVADIVGTELARRLTDSPPRSLTILYGGDALLEAIEWESLDLGNASLACHFALARQIATDTDLPLSAPASLSRSLMACVVHGGSAPPGLALQAIAFDALDQESNQAALARARAIVLDGIPLSHWMERASWACERRLLIATRFEPTPPLAAVLDAGAAVLCLDVAGDTAGEAIISLVRQLDSGAGIGEAARALHRIAAPRPLPARLYGDPDLRFVRPSAPTSRRQVTSLSFDLVGSTTLLASVGDEAYADTLADVHARCTDIVRRHGGLPDDPQGDDGVMGYFGHPSALENAAVRAVDAALAIARTVAELGVMVRVGIATGLVAVKDGQPVGLSIHLAARLQQAAAPGIVLASESTHRLVDHAYHLEALHDQPHLKGIDAAEPVYRVLGPRRDAEEHRLERHSALTPMVGRQYELDRLHRCWTATGTGDTRLAVVSAEAGMGKSRLVREFRRQLVRDGVKVLECRCRTDADASPFLALGEALRRWLDIRDDDAPAVSLHKLAAALPCRAREAEPLAMLAALLGLAPHPPRAGSGNSRQRVLDLLFDWFQSFAGDQPCCLIVEDWQWVDPSTREFVEHVVERPGGPGLMIVVTSRSNGKPPPFEIARHEHIRLSGLLPAEARQLVEHVCRDAPLSPRLVALLAARGDGVPLFLEEAARMALEVDAQRADGELQALEAVPESLNDLLMVRLDALGAAKRVAQVAAVLGRQFSRELLAALLDAAGHAPEIFALDDQLAVLVGSGLVRAEPNGRFAFRHALIRDAADASMWVRERRSLHAKVVKLLQQRWPESVARQPELLALHQTEAGLHAEALKQWELAARHAAARSAEREAISHLRSALRVLEQTEPGIERERTELRLLLLLAARLLATEGYGADAVLQTYLEAQRLGDAVGDDTSKFKIEMGLEAYRFMRADFTPALEHGRRAAAIAARSGEIKQRLHAHWGLACTLFHQGELRATMREMDAALKLYTPALHSQFGIQDPGVMCMAYSSWGLWELGLPDAALARINQAVALADEVQHRFSQAVAMSYSVSVLLLRGEMEAALLRADACARICEDAGFPVWLAITRCLRGRLLCERGELLAGLREMDDGYAQWLATGAMVSQPLCLALQIEGLMLAGQLDAAAARVDEGLAIIARCGERQLEAEMTRLRGEIALRRGEAAEGEGWLRRAYVLAMRRHRLGFALRSATALARLWTGDGRHERARRLLPPLASHWREGRGTRDLRAAEAVIESLR
jgi:class 3 adenylate cyclase